ncbi:MAG: hypothetical protein KDC44_20630 [Phaeodactylibacter sp.]|nr:hypothetical protein [Phaeodactylibacter sp.]
MRYTVLLLTLACWGLVGWSTLSAQDLPAGVWKVVQPPAEISTYYPVKKAVPYRKERITIQQKHYEFFFTNTGKEVFLLEKSSCSSPDYVYEIETETSFYKRQGIPIDSLMQSAPKEIASWSIACTDRTVNPAVSFYRINPEYIMLAYQGLICYFKKVKDRPGCWPFRWLRKTP